MIEEASVPVGYKTPSCRVITISTASRILNDSLESMSESNGSEWDNQ